MTVDEAIRALWGYHHMHHQLKPADCLFVLGNSDIRTADRAVELYEQGLAPLVLITGGAGRYTKDMFTESEASVFAQRMTLKGVPPRVIFQEDQSTNTGDNFVMGMKKLVRLGYAPGSLIVVTKPYMERRAYATGMKQLSGVTLQMASPTVAWEDYPTEELPRDKVINIMVGDLQRIIEYPKLGFQIEQDVPPEVRAAMEYLISQGYDQALIKKK
jgi:uncharacterized SAM-binding protein YcdF (DUF218 family)